MRVLEIVKTSKVVSKIRGNGFNHVTILVEEQKVALVIIAHDVDPIELAAFR